MPDVFTTAVLARGDTKVRGHFSETHCGPSRRGEQMRQRPSKFRSSAGKRLFNSIRQKQPLVPGVDSGVCPVDTAIASARHLGKIEIFKNEAVKLTYAGMIASVSNLDK
jgi:hypothetical protein